MCVYMVRKCPIWSDGWVGVSKGNLLSVLTYITAALSVWRISDREALDVTPVPWLAAPHFL